MQPLQGNKLAGKKRAFCELPRSACLLDLAKVLLFLTVSKIAHPISVSFGLILVYLYVAKTWAV